MTATDLLTQLIRDGFTLTREAEGIRVKPASSLTPSQRQAIRERRRELLELVPRMPWSPTPEEEAALCRMIEKDQGWPAGSVRLYTPKEFRQRFGKKAR